VLRASDGTYPGDRLDCLSEPLALLRKRMEYLSRGEETFSLPAGMTTLTAAHGLDYRAESKSVEIEAGKLLRVELKLQKTINLRKAGWVGR